MARTEACELWRAHRRVTHFLFLRTPIGQRVQGCDARPTSSRDVGVSVATGALFVALLDSHWRADIRRLTDGYSMD